MTMLALYESKKALKEAVGQPLKYRETSMFGQEYKADGRITVAGRPHHVLGIQARVFAQVTMVSGKIAKVE